MLKTAIIIIASFFAVIGFIECILNMLETVSFWKYKRLDSVELSVGLSGTVENPTFLLNTLLLQAERITYPGVTTHVVVRDNGLDSATFSEIHSFCEENDNIRVEMTE